METRPSPPANTAHPGFEPGRDPREQQAPRAAPHAMNLADEAREEAGRSARDLREKASDTMRDAKTRAGEAAEHTKRKAVEYADQARVRGQEMLDQQKHHAAERLHTVGQAVHRAADKFREERDDNIAGYVDAVAEEVDRLADFIDRRGVRDIARDAQDFARREPEWFLGGMFLAGLALTRFLKASGERYRRERGGYAAHDREMSYGSSYDSRRDIGTPLVGESSSSSGSSTQSSPSSSIRSGATGTAGATGSGAAPSALANEESTSTRPTCPPGLTSVPVEPLSSADDLASPTDPTPFLPPEQQTPEVPPYGTQTHGT